MHAEKNLKYTVFGSFQSADNAACQTSPKPEKSLLAAAYTITPGRGGGWPARQIAVPHVKSASVLKMAALLYRVIGRHSGRHIVASKDLVQDLP
jgi:hypothetical protein